MISRWYSPAGTWIVLFLCFLLEKIMKSFHFLWNHLNSSVSLPVLTAYSLDFPWPVRCGEEIALISWSSVSFDLASWSTTKNIGRFKFESDLTKGHSASELKHPINQMKSWVFFIFFLKDLPYFWIVSQTSYSKLQITLLHVPNTSKYLLLLLHNFHFINDLTYY